MATHHYLLVSASNRLCALPIGSVLETMRPLPTVSLPGLPDWLRGFSVVRAAPTPVVDLGRRLALPSSSEPRRFVTVRSGHAVVAVAVDSIRGLEDLSGATAPEQGHSAALPNEVITGVVLHRRELVLLVSPTELVPESVWTQLPTGAPA